MLSRGIARTDCCPLRRHTPGRNMRLCLSPLFHVQWRAPCNAAHPDPASRHHRTLGGCPTGEVRLTQGCRLPARYVTHAVAPRYRDGKHGKPDQLAGCYRNSPDLAIAHNLKTIAFPAISCGIYGYPIQDAARLATGSVRQILSTDRTIEHLIFTCFCTEAMDAVIDPLRRSCNG